MPNYRAKLVVEPNYQNTCALYIQDTKTLNTVAYTLGNLGGAFQVAESHRSKWPASITKGSETFDFTIKNGDFKLSQKQLDATVGAPSLLSPTSIYRNIFDNRLKSEEDGYQTISLVKTPENSRLSKIVIHASPNGLLEASFHSNQGHECSLMQIQIKNGKPKVHVQTAESEKFDLKSPFNLTPKNNAGTLVKLKSGFGESSNQGRKWAAKHHSHTQNVHTNQQKNIHHYKPH